MQQQPYDEGQQQVVQQHQQQQRRRRTIDVTTGAASFEELMLPHWLLGGLAAGGFIRYVCLSSLLPTFIIWARFTRVHMQQLKA